MKRLTVGALFVLGFFVINIAYLEYSEKFFDLFRLSGSDTVYDFHNSSIDDSVAWLTRMCRDGKCLDHIDWRCGFDLGDESEMSQCFIDQAHLAKSWVKLDSIRKYCGKKYAIFNKRFGSEQECSELGGKWGEIKHFHEIPR